MDFKIMKKIVFGLLVTMGMLNAQNNLVFNQVLILDFTNNAAEPYIVPEGKVWKVESATLGSTFKVDGNTWTMGDLGSYRMGPIWIPENSALSGGSSDADFISVLEFDVVPTSTGTGSATGGGGVSSDGLVFSQMINEVIVVQPTNNTGTILYSFEVPVGHVYKVLHLSNNKWNSTYSEYQGGAGDIFISQNGEPINPNRPTLSGDSLFLKEGNYDVVYYTGPNNSTANEYSKNRLYIYAIDYIVP